MVRKIIIGGLIIVGAIIVIRAIKLNNFTSNNLEKKESEQSLEQNDTKKETEYIGEECQVWIKALPKDIKANQDFDIKIYANMHNQKLGVFNMFLDFDAEGITINKDKGENGFDKGKDTQEYMIMVNPEHISSGHYRFAGITANNFVQDDREELIIIHAKTTKDFKAGKHTLSIRINEFGNELGKSFKTKFIGSQE